MKVTFKITHASVLTLMAMMEYAAIDESYAWFGPADQHRQRDPEAVEWVTTGGNRYIVLPNLNRLEYYGSRISLAGGAGFGGIISDKNRPGKYRVYANCGVYWDAPIVKEYLYTSWSSDVPGWNDPFCTEAELISMKELMDHEPEWEELCTTIEERLMA